MPTKKPERKQRKRSIYAGLCACGVVLGGFFFWRDRYEANLERVNMAQTNVLTFVEETRHIAPDKINRDYLAPLNTIGGAAHLFDDYRNMNMVAAELNLSQGDKIAPVLEQAYLDVLNNDFMVRLVRSLGQDLANTCPKGSEKELQRLRIYRMLGDMDRRHDEVIRQYFANIWQREFPANADVQSGLADHLDYALTVSPRAYELNETLVAQSREHLTSTTPYRRVFAALQSEAVGDYPSPINFANTAGASFGIVYDKEPAANTLPDDGSAAGDGTCDAQLVGVNADERKPFTIPQFYSKRLFHEFFVPRNAEITAVAAEDLWVMGAANGTDYGDVDYEVIQDNTRRIYVDEYIANWRGALNDLSVRPFADIRDATQELRVVSSTESPLQRIAQLVSENTYIYQEDIPAEELPAEGTVEAKNRRAGLEINAAFANIRAMMEPRADGSPSQMREMLDALNALYAYTNQIAQAADPQAKALEIAIDRANLQGDDPIYVVRRMAERAPAPFGRHLETLANETWRIIMTEATTALSRKWQGEVYGEYQRLLAGKYPFNRQSNEDVPVEDFIAFFGPDGILQDFYKTELLAFVEERTGEPVPIDGQSLTISQDFIDELQKSIAISNAFFDAGGELRVAFKVEPKRMSAGLSRAILNIEGQVVSYGRGPTQASTVIWPNIIDGPIISRVDMSPASRNGRISIIERDGPWSWLRLYDAAAKSNFTNNSVDLTFSSNTGNVTFQYRAERKVNPFFNSPLSGFTLPVDMNARSGEDAAL